METDYLLAYHMHVRRPEFFKVRIGILVVHEAERGAVIEQRIHPNIHNMARVKIHGYAPGEAGAAYAKILKAGVYKVLHHFVYPACGFKEIAFKQQFPYRLGIF